MALYVILFGLSIFMIALVLTIIKKMFFCWKEEHKIERMTITTVDRPAVCVMICMEKCVIRQRKYADHISIFDVIDKSDISLQKKGSKTSIASFAEHTNDVKKEKQNSTT